MRKKPARRGFCGIGIYRTKTGANIGTLWRSALVLGADFIFTVAARYRYQSSDTMKSWRHIPLWHFDTFADLKEHLPHDCPLVGVEIDDRATSLGTFRHPERAVYLLGAEDNGLSKEIMGACHRLVRLPGDHCLNVASAGSIVLYDRWRQMEGT